MTKRLAAFLACLLACGSLCAQQIDIGLSITSGGRLLSAYPEYSPGINGNPLAPIFAHGDGGMGDVTFISGLDGPVLFPRQPVAVKAANGDLLEFAQVHESSTSTTGDSGISAIVMRRSTDKGVNFGTWQIVYHETSYVRGVTWINFGVVVVNELTGRIHVLFTHTISGNAATPPLPTDQADIDAYWTYSDNHGATWQTATDISANVKKTSGLTAPFAKANEEWGWYIFGPSKGIQIKRGTHAGRLIAPADHRYSRGTEAGSADMGSAASNESWSHVCYCDDDETWLLGGGLDETDTANDYTNEFSVCEYGTDGELFGFIRKVSGTGSGYKCSSRSLDGGATWEDVTINDGTGGTTNLASSSTQGCVESTPNGDIYAMFVGDSAIRSSVSIAKSTDGGETFPTRRILDYKMGAYSSLLAVDASSLFASWEHVASTADHTTAGYNPSQYILARRLPTSWVKNTYYDDFDWYFNDFIGTPTAQQAIGLSIKDRGTTKLVHGRLLPGGTGSANGLTTSGSALAALIWERNYNGTTQAALPGPCDIDPLKDWHMEFVGFASTDATGGVRRVADNRHATSGAGWNVNLTNSANFLQFSVGDNAAHTASVSSAVAVNDGTPRNLRISYIAATQTLQVYVDGVASGSSASTASLTGSWISTAASTVLGGLGTGSSYSAYSIKRLRVTRGTRTDFLDGTESRPSLESFYNYAVTTPPSLPASAATAKLFVGATYDGGWNCGLDHYGGWDKGALPLLSGSGYQSYRDLASGKFFQAQSQNQGMHWSSDSVIGNHHRLTYSSVSANGAWRCSNTNLGTILDGIQRNGKFTLRFDAKLEADTTGSQTLFSTTQNNTNGNGIIVLYFRSNATTGLVYTRIVGTNGSSTKVNVYNNTVTGAQSMTIGTWYAVTIQGSGFGNALRAWVVPYAGGLVAPTMGSGSTGPGTLTDPVPGMVSQAAGQPLAIGATSDGSGNASNARMKNIAVWTTEGASGSDDDVLDATAVQSWPNFSVAY